MHASPQCRQCGKCCRQDFPVTLWDVHRLRLHLARPAADVFRETVKPERSAITGLLRLRERPDGACNLLDENNQCRAHAAKPLACRLFHCPEAEETFITPWAEAYQPEHRAETWLHAVAAEVTRAYLDKHGATFDEADFARAIQGIKRNLSFDAPPQEATNGFVGRAQAQALDCSTCWERRSDGCVTPVTLEDVGRLAEHFDLDLLEAFSRFVETEPSFDGVLQLKREPQCVFFDGERGCRAERDRPMHCRFAPCPRATPDPHRFDRFFLAGGTLAQQFRHRVAQHVTREYVSRAGCRYDGDMVRRYLGKIEWIASDRDELLQFCEHVREFRDDVDLAFCS
jgi:Fe-S-cluster containining protein